MERKINAKLSNNLRRLRVANHFSQERLCAVLQINGYDVSRSNYAKYETNLLYIRADMLVVLQKIYKCDYAEFFKDVN